MNPAHDSSVCLPVTSYLSTHRMWPLLLLLQITLHSFQISTAYRPAVETGRGGQLRPPVALPLPYYSIRPFRIVRLSKFVH